MRSACVELTSLSGSATRGISTRSPVTMDRCCGRVTARRSRSCGAPTATRVGAVSRLPRLHHPPAQRLEQRRPAIRPRGRARAGTADAKEFVAHVRRRVHDGGVCVCALDTELLGHWWFEGPWWLEAVLDEAAREGLALTTLDDALERHDPVRGLPVPPVSSWGDGGDLRTWSGPQVAELAWAARTAELKLIAAPRPARGPCVSCWRCNRATGRSWPRTGPRAITRVGARAGTTARGVPSAPSPDDPALGAGAARAARPTSPLTPAEGPRRLAHPDHLRRDPTDDRVGGTSQVTTALVPITALSPTSTPRSRQAP